MPCSPDRVARAGMPIVTKPQRQAHERALEREQPHGRGAEQAPLAVLLLLRGSTPASAR